MKTKSSTVQADYLIVSTRPGYLQLGAVANPDTQNLWLCLVDKATAPVNGDVPVQVVLVPQGTNNTIEGPSGIGNQELGLRCHTGIVLCLSTTVGSVTLPATDAGFFTAVFN